MAELAETKGRDPPRCCGRGSGECCEPTRRSAAPESSSCGCAEEAGGEEIRDAVRSRYAAAATSVTEKSEAGEACCGSGTALTDEEAKVFGASLYDEDSRGELPDTATMASLGCGNPTAVAELGAGETVLDLGSGGGIDVLLSAKRVGPQRQGLRPRYDRRDARPGPGEPAQGGRGERRVVARRDRVDPASRRERRRGDLQLRHQPLRRQAQGACRGRAGSEARRALRGLRCGGRRGHGRGDPGRHGRSGPAASPAP